MPVSGHLHWSTLVMCNLDVFFARCFNGSVVADDRIPCILHLDSYGGVHVTSIISDISRKIILDEWRALCTPRILAAPAADRIFLQCQCDGVAAQLRRLPVVCPNVPHQPNFIDCGVYHIAFVEDIKLRNLIVTAADLISNPPCSRLYNRNVFSHDVCVVSFFFFF